MTHGSLFAALLGLVIVAGVDRPIPVLHGFHLWNLMHDTMPGKRPAAIIAFFTPDCRDELEASRFIPEARNFPSRTILTLGFYDYESQFDFVWWDKSTDMDLDATQVLGLNTKDHCFQLVYFPPNYHPFAMYPQFDGTFDRNAWQHRDVEFERNRYEVWVPPKDRPRGEWKNALFEWMWPHFVTMTELRNRHESDVYFKRAGSSSKGHALAAGDWHTWNLTSGSELVFSYEDGREICRGVVPHEDRQSLMVDAAPTESGTCYGMVSIQDFRHRGEVLRARDQDTSFTDATMTFQPGVMPSYTPDGYQLKEMPRRVRKALDDFYAKWQNAGRMRDEWAAKPDKALKKTTINGYNVEPGLTSLDLDQREKNRIAQMLKPLAAQWIGYEPEQLELTSFYGLRQYYEGNFLRLHVDRSSTHIISMILLVGQEDLQEDWPLEILDHAGRRKNLLMKPGQLLLYESAKLVHGRPRAFHGGKFLNCFVHYMPSPRAPGGRWSYHAKNDILYNKEEALYDAKLQWFTRAAQQPNVPFDTHQMVYMGGR